MRSPSIQQPISRLFSWEPIQLRIVELGPFGWLHASRAARPAKVQLLAPNSGSLFLTLRSRTRGLENKKNGVLLGGRKAMRAAPGVSNFFLRHLT